MKTTATKTRFTRYANLTDDQRDAICEGFLSYRQLGCNAEHAVACAAHQLVSSDRAWNSKVGGDAFAAALATLVMRDKLTIVDSGE